MSDQAATPADSGPASVGYSRPAHSLRGNWSAHVATTLDRLALLADGFDDEQWNAASMCSGWRIRDVFGHLIWRIGEPTGALASSIMRTDPIHPNRAIERIAIEFGSAEPETLIARLREIAAEKVRGEGRHDLTENVEAVVHSYDVTEALGIAIRLSPRSTAAAAMQRLRTSAKVRRRASEIEFLATDARWCIGRGRPVEGTAGEILMDLYGRRPLEA